MYDVKQIYIVKAHKGILHHESRILLCGWRLLEQYMWIGIEYSTRILLKYIIKYSFERSFEWYEFDNIILNIVTARGRRSQELDLQN